MEQLNLFSFWVKEVKENFYEDVKNFYFAWKQYIRLNLLDSFKTDWSRIIKYVNQLMCDWFDSNDELENTYYENEKIRDYVLENLNKWYWIDKMWNNLKWYFKTQIYIKWDKKLENIFKDEFIYWIWHLEKTK